MHELRLGAPVASPATNLRAAVAALCLVAAGGLSGCGGDQDEEGTSVADADAQVEREQKYECELFFNEDLGGFWYLAASAQTEEPGEPTWAEENAMGSLPGTEELSRALASGVKNVSGSTPEAVYASYGFKSAADAEAKAQQAIAVIATACREVGADLDIERIAHAQKRAGDSAKRTYGDYGKGGPEPEPDPSTDEPDLSPAPETDRLTALAPTLAERGLTEADVENLGRMADATGYGLGPGTALSFEQAVDFAYVMVSACEETSTDEGWAARVEQDVLDGAPRTAAEQMNGYVRDTFCPKIR